eukprot:602430-Pyramimonas_sp.AAC.1
MSAFCVPQWGGGPLGALLEPSGSSLGPSWSPIGTLLEPSGGPLGVPMGSPLRYNDPLKIARRTCIAPCMWGARV